MLRDDRPVAADPALVPCLLLQVGLFAPAAKLEVGKMVQLVQSQVFGKLLPHPLGSAREAIPPACFIREDDAEIDCRISGPITCDVETNPNYVGGKVERDPIDLFLRGQSGGHEWACLQDTLPIDANKGAIPVSMSSPANFCLSSTRRSPRANRPHVARILMQID